MKSVATRWNFTESRVPPDPMGIMPHSYAVSFTRERRAALPSRWEATSIPAVMATASTSSRSTGRYWASCVSTPAP